MEGLDFFESELFRSILKIKTSEYLESEMSTKGAIPVGPMNDFEKKAYTVSALYFKEAMVSERVLSTLNGDGVDSITLRESMLDSMSKAGLAWDYMALSIRARFPGFRSVIAITKGFNIAPFSDGSNMPEDKSDWQVDSKKVDFLIKYEWSKISLGLTGCETQQ